MTLSMRRAAIRLKTDSITNEGVFTGYGSVFNVLDSYGTVMLPGCFADSLASHAAAGTMPKGLWQHDGNFPILRWTSMAEDDVGLLCTGQLILEVEKARETHALLKAGAIDGLSIGFEPVEMIEATAEEAADQFGLELDPARADDQGLFGLYRRNNLWEVSVVTFPSNEEATVETVLSKSPTSPDYSALAAALARRNDALKKLCTA